MRCKNVFHFSVLHLAVKHGHEELVVNIIHLIQQVPPTVPSTIDIANRNGRVSDVQRVLLKMQNVL